MELLSSDQLYHLVADPRPAASPWSGAPLLLIDGDSTQNVNDPGIGDWIRHVPAPVIIIGGAASMVAEAGDVHLNDSSGLQRLIDNIRAHPLAATVLVQTLRLTARLGMEDGLIAESLAYASLQNGAEFRHWQARFRAPDAQSPDPGPPIDIERDGGLLKLSLNRPGNRNAMSIEMRDALIEALALALADDSIERVLVEGRGPCFSTGGDLREFGTAPDPATAHAVRSVALPGRLLLQLASRATAKVHGACIGSGIEFPAFAGRVIARGDAWFQLPELRYGLIPGAGGTVSISRRIGRQRTAWLALSGAKLNVRTALDWGLVDAIVD